VNGRALRTARAVWAVAAKDARVALTERMSMLQALTLPLNYLIMMSLFALAGGHDPAALVMADNGSYARTFASSMASARTFNITDTTATQAAGRMRAGNLVAAVTIPPAFDQDIRDHKTATVRLAVNNLNQDLTDDAERGMRLALDEFYQSAAPGQVPVSVAFQDQYASDTGYIPFLAMSVVVISLLVAGLLAAGNAAAREYEERTMRGLLLAPVSLWHILAGRILGAFLISLPSVAIVMAVVTVIAGDRPEHPLIAAGTALLTLAASCAAGTALGTIARDRSTVAVITRALPVPLFFLTGVFAPLSYFPPAVQWIGGLLPVHYAVVLTQWGFRGLVTGTLPLLADAVILAATLLAFAAAGATALHQSARTRPARQRPPALTGAVARAR
jgi:ABC-type transport system involved in multi-copper enzyme maturation permease subunit